GLTGPNPDDGGKEIAIYRAHRAAPIVIATEGERRFGAALETIGVPAVHPDVAFVLSAMAGPPFRRRGRAVRHGGPPVRVRGRARHRHVGASAARGARGGGGGRDELGPGPVV